MKIDKILPAANELIIVINNSKLIIVMLSKVFTISSSGNLELYAYRLIPSAMEFPGLFCEYYTHTG